MHDIIVSESYIDNRQRYKNDILTYLTLIFNLDIAIHIYKYYDQIFKDNLNDHINKYEILKPSSLLVDDFIYLKPYTFNKMFKNRIQYNNYYKYVYAKQTIIKIINMIGHPDFICHTNIDLKKRGCKGLSNYLRSELVIGVEGYHREIGILINIERMKLNVCKKIKIIEDIFKMNHQYTPREVCRTMFIHYTSYINIDDLYITGYMIDTNNIIYGP
jgi:hypothetical protein